MRIINTFIILSFFLLTSCGLNDEEKVENALDVVLFHLTEGDCTSAIKEINAITEQPGNVRYIKFKAAAYACRAGYSTTNFFANDLAKLGSANLLSGFATMSLSNEMTYPDHPTYTDLQIAIDTLLFAGGIQLGDNPTAAQRAAIFNTKAQAEINSFLLYLVVNQLGLYSHYYGTTSALGAKTECFYKYAFSVGAKETVADTYLGANGGACTGTGSLTAHPDLLDNSDPANPIMNVERACQGIILLNTLINTLDNIADLGSISSDLTGIGAAVDALYTAMAAAGLSFNNDLIKTVQGQQMCEGAYGGGVGADNDDLQLFFVALFETLHKTP
jgi:hypothetical protein